MFMVQIQESGSSKRYSGFGDSLEQAVTDLFKHFSPTGIEVSPRTVRVYRRCDTALGFKPLSDTELPEALRKISAAMAAM